MFQIKSFTDFANSAQINEDVSNKWVFDPEKPDSGDLAKFSFKAKVQHQEGAGEQAIGNAVAAFVANKLSTEERFVRQLRMTDRIPVMYPKRDTEGGFFTGDRGILTGDIVFVDSSAYDQEKLKAINPFMPKNATTGLVVNGSKIYDATLLDAAKGGGSQKGKEIKILPEEPEDEQGDVKKSDQTTRILKTLMSFTFGAKADLIKWLNAAMTVLDDSLTKVLIKNGVINDTYNNEMAAAIQKIVGDSAPVTKITLDVAKALKSKLDTITTDQVNTRIGQYSQGVLPSVGSAEISQLQGYVKGLKQGDANLKVGMLQQALTFIDPSAGTLIAQKGGIDNKYGPATSQALQIVLKTAAPVTEITDDISKSLIQKAAALTPEQVKQILATIDKALSGTSNQGKPNPSKNKGGSNSGGGKSYPKSTGSKSGASL